MSNVVDLSTFRTKSRNNDKNSARVLYFSFESSVGRYIKEMIGNLSFRCWYDFYTTNNVTFESRFSVYPLFKHAILRLKPNEAPLHHELLSACVKHFNIDPNDEVGTYKARLLVELIDCVVSNSVTTLVANAQLALLTSEFESQNELKTAMKSSIAECISLTEQISTKLLIPELALCRIENQSFFENLLLSAVENNAFAFLSKILFGQSHCASAEAIRNKLKQTRSFNLAVERVSKFLDLALSVAFLNSIK